MRVADVLQQDQLAPFPVGGQAAVGVFGELRRAVPRGQEGLGRQRLRRAQFQRRICGWAGPAVCGGSVSVGLADRNSCPSAKPTSGQGSRVRPDRVALPELPAGRVALEQRPAAVVQRRELGERLQSAGEQPLLNRAPGRSSRCTTSVRRRCWPVAYRYTVSSASTTGASTVCTWVAGNTASARTAHTGRRVANHGDTLGVLWVYVDQVAMPGICRHYDDRPCRTDGLQSVRHSLRQVAVFSPGRHSLARRIEPPRDDIVIEGNDGGAGRQVGPQQVHLLVALRPRTCR